MEMVPQLAFPKVKRSAWVYDRNIERCWLRGPMKVFYSFAAAHLSTRSHQLWEGRLPRCFGVVDGSPATRSELDYLARAKGRHPGTPGRIHCFRTPPDRLGAVPPIRVAKPTSRYYE